MDERVEAFLADIRALEGEETNAIRQGVRSALADYEQIFRSQEVNKRMKDKAAHACHALCRSRVVEEIPAEGNTNRRPLKSCAQRYRGAALPIKGCIGTVYRGVPRTLFHSVRA